jgi:transposase
MVWGDRARVRAELYMAAIVAARFNPLIRVFYQRLCAAGKAKKLALVACTHKLLTAGNCQRSTQTSHPRNPTLVHHCLVLKTVAISLFSSRNQHS